MFVRGRGGIGIRARLRGVSGNGYGFKSRRPHVQILMNVRIFSYTKIPACLTGICSVEMRGVEPLSESTSERLSPSAFRGYDSPNDVRGKPSFKVASFLRIPLQSLGGIRSLH